MRHLYTSITSRRALRSLSALAVTSVAALGGPVGLSHAAASHKPAAASTKPAPDDSYDVSFVGTYEARATEGDPGGMSATRTMNASWSSQSATPVLLSVLPTKQTAVVVTKTPITTFDGTYHEVIYSEPPRIQDCSLTQSAPAGTGIIGAQTASNGEITLDVQPFDQIYGVNACTLPVPYPLVSLNGSDFSAKVTIPASSVGQPTITIPVTNQASLPCPVYDYTLSCDVAWHGVVQLTLTSNPDIVPLVPAPTGGSGGAGHPGGSAGSGGSSRPGGAGHPGGSTSSSGEDVSDLLFPLVDPMIGFGPRDLDVVFHAACPGGCAGTATISVPRTSGGPGRAPHLTLAAAVTASAPLRFSVPAGSSAHRVTLALGARTRAAIRRAGGATVSLVLKDRHSHKVTRTSRHLTVS